MRSNVLMLAMSAALAIAALFVGCYHGDPPTPHDPTCPPGSVICDPTCLPGDDCARRPDGGQR